MIFREKISRIFGWRRNGNQRSSSCIIKILFIRRVLLNWPKRKPPHYTEEVWNRRKKWLLRFPSAFVVEKSITLRTCVSFGIPSAMVVKRLVMLWRSVLRKRGKSKDRKVGRKVDAKVEIGEKRRNSKSFVWSKKIWNPSNQWKEAIGPCLQSQIPVENVKRSSCQ